MTASRDVVRRTLRRLRSQRGGAAASILIQRQVTSPEVSLAMRVGLVLLLLTAVFTVFLLDRSGLQDNVDGNVSVTDVLRQRWDLSVPWADWLVVERLAAAPRLLAALCARYSKLLEHPLEQLTADWAARTAAWLNTHGLR